MYESKKLWKIVNKYKVNYFQTVPTILNVIVNSNFKSNHSYNNLIEETEESNDEYLLNSNIFNPSKMSPPNEWKNRLENRIRIYFSQEQELNIEKYK